MSEYNPVQHSIVQAMVGTWCQYECDDFVAALLTAILEEIKRVHWNVYQHTWRPSWHGDEIEDPEVPGIAFVRYYDGCPCEDEDEDEHRPDCRHAKPNFQYEDVQFRWYKYPGRGMSTNKDWTPDEWRVWFVRCLTTIRAFDVDHLSEADGERQEQLRQSMRERFPKAFDVKIADDVIAAHRRLIDWFDWMDDAQTPCWVCSEAGLGAGGGCFESGAHGMVARTLHEADDPNGPCVNCGHVNTDEQTGVLAERRRLNSDADRWNDDDAQADDAVGQRTENPI
jgi:hypothetical protein